tara:strand:+ start:2177 stop:2521 length:345 start_codon:yes stop_codon:yes gene_type:complete
MALAFANFRVAMPGWRDDGRTEPPILIELTAKRWKGLTLLAAILAWLGIGVLMWHLWHGLYAPLLETGLAPSTKPADLFANAFSGFAVIFSMALLASAAVIGFYARFMAWWRHG